MNCCGRSEASFRRQPAATETGGNSDPSAAPSTTPTLKLDSGQVLAAPGNAIRWHIFAGTAFRPDRAVITGTSACTTDDACAARAKTADNDTMPRVTTISAAMMPRSRVINNVGRLRMTRALFPYFDGPYATADLFEQVTTS